MAQSAAVRSLAIGAALAVALACAATPSRAAEAPAPDARVVAASGDYLYVTRNDSGPLPHGATAHVFRSKRLLATGRVEQVLHGVVAAVRLTSGTLSPGTRLDRLVVRIEMPGRPPNVTLRLGVPASGRANLLIACGQARLDLTVLPRAYAAEPTAQDDTRLVAMDSIPSAWPDTILVRWFADATDEEIALELGEIDAALFWPGEASARLREHAYRGYEAHGTRARGVLAMVGAPTDSTRRLRAVLQLLKEGTRWFGSDLAAHEAIANAEFEGVRSDGPAAERLRWSVDEALPGRRLLEASLNRAVPRGAHEEAPLRLVLLDAPAHASAPTPPDWRAGDVTPVFTVRCAIFATVGRADDVHQLDHDVLANLVACGAGSSP